MTALPSALTAALADRYRLEREIGAGGMATVYLAYDVRHRREVAIKVFQPELAKTVGADRFLREIQIAAQLHHPHILPLHDSGEAAGCLYYLMPFVDGETLRARLRREGQLPIDTAVHITREVADALGYAHRRGVIHRDIKPENILLSDGHAYVADFGIARAVDTAAGSLTQTGFALGTPAYMAPEQAVGEKAIDGRADLYALGCVLHEMLTGAPPYTGATQQAVLVKRFTEPVPLVRSLRADAPVWLEVLVAHTLAKEPEGRPRNAEAVLTALTQPVSTPPASPAPVVEVSPSIVVLPFANANPDPDMDYFADGLTEEVIADLSNVRALRVIARNSAMRLKGTDKDVRTIGRDLNVSHVLAGSVRRAGNQLRITAQLAEAANDKQVWAGKFNGSVEDVFDLQERLSREIVASLQLALTTEEHLALAERRIGSPLAYELLLKARQEMYKTTKPSLDRAIAFLTEAERAEGLNVRIVATLCVAYGWYAMMGWECPFDPMERVREQVRHIMSIAPGSPEAEFGQATLDMFADKPEIAIRVVRRVIALRPSDTDALSLFWMASTNAGLPDLMRLAARRLGEVDPLSYPAHVSAGLVEMMSGNYPAAALRLERGLKFEPDNFDLRVYHAWSLALSGRREVAAEQYEQLAKESATWSAGTADWCRLCAAGMRNDARAIRAATTTELRAFLAASNPLWMVPAGEACAVAGLPEEAMSWIENHFARNCGPYLHLVKSPLYNSLRTLPRFNHFLTEARRQWEELATRLRDIAPF